MNPSLRYIITRPCLSEGSLTVAKYLQGLFPVTLAGQTLALSDEQGREYPVQLSASGKRLLGLGVLYHAYNLDVNDVLMLSETTAGHYAVACVVKPHTERLNAPARSDKPAEPTRRVVVSATPHVREVRMERAVPVAPAAAVRVTEHRPDAQDAQASTKPDPARSDTAGSEQQAAQNQSVHNQSAEDQRRSARHAAPRREPLKLEAVQDASEYSAAQAHSAQMQPSVVPVRGEAVRGEVVRGETTRSEPPRPGQPQPSQPQPSQAQPGHTQPGAAKSAPQPALLQPALLETVADQLSELAQLTGYQVEYLGGHEAGPVRLRADLGNHSYDVMLALSEAEIAHPAYRQGSYRALLSWERDTPASSPRFTREALGALLEHARLAPLTPIDLRGYWNTSSFDLDSVASLAELVSAHLVQRGTFTYVLGTLAQQPAHSVVDPTRLAERLGSGVNTAELNSILETLCRAPFMALMPLPGHQYYLRCDVNDLLRDLSEYAQSVGRRLQPQVKARV
ncbi:hypothetical protein [Deinococcus sp.]|uniref:hypothetical protein n=1 Tax=Deinococcus sp. TaxID=47478 RepID=UPI0025CF785F|nr:hypothetical protein [Deinococcus sp.]